MGRVDAHEKPEEQKMNRKLLPLAAVPVFVLLPGAAPQPGNIALTDASASGQASRSTIRISGHPVGACATQGREL